MSDTKLSIALNSEVYSVSKCSYSSIALLPELPYPCITRVNMSFKRYAYIHKVVCISLLWIVLQTLKQITHFHTKVYIPEPTKIFQYTFFSQHCNALPQNNLKS